MISIKIIIFDHPILCVYWIWYLFICCNGFVLPRPFFQNYCVLNEFDPNLFIFLLFQIVEYNMRVDCKCHGVSGSCETKTCWRALPRFRLVGSLLRERFDRAAEVRPGGRRLVPVGTQLRHHSDTDLVYLESSPDFCEQPGTRGRPCNRTTTEEGCDTLCCGRGYETKTEKVLERCDCKFYWCCFVKCRECERDVEKNYCL